MNNPINNTVFDSRDLIKYLEELETEANELWEDYEDNNPEGAEETDQNTWLKETHPRTFEHLENVRDFCSELEDCCPDFNYGATIIENDYFQEYAKELVKDIGDLPADLPGYIEHNIDWEGVADDIARDYTIVSYENNDYYIR